MKTIALSLGLLLAAGTACFAQCEKTLVLTSSKTEHLNDKGVLQRTNDENVVIELNKTDLNVSANDEHKLTAKIKSQSCDWKVPFKEGKTFIKGAATNDQGEEHNVTITIEGKDGKVTVLFEVDDMPDHKVRLGIDKFVEKAA